MSINSRIAKLERQIELLGGKASDIDWPELFKEWSEVELRLIIDHIENGVPISDELEYKLNQVAEGMEVSQWV